MKRVFYVPKNFPLPKYTNLELQFMVTMGAPVKTFEVNDEASSIRFKSLVLSLIQEKMKQLHYFNYAYRIMEYGLSIKVSRPFVFELSQYIDHLRNSLPKTIPFIENYDDSQCEITAGHEFSDVKRNLYLPDAVALYSTTWANKLKVKGYEVLASFIECYLKFDYNLEFLRVRKIVSDVLEVQRLINMLYIISFNRKKDSKFSALEQKYIQQIDSILDDIKSSDFAMAKDINIVLKKDDLPSTIEEIRRYFEI